MEKEIKTFIDLHEGEIFTDNSKIKKCEQCKDCEYRDGGDTHSNHYYKCHCQMYPYPHNKPLRVMDGTEDCDFYEKE